jgi:CubicO group peptidase (beta-lactamase class C family)
MSRSRFGRKGLMLPRALLICGVLAAACGGFVGQTALGEWPPADAPKVAADGTRDGNASDDGDLGARLDRAIVRHSLGTTWGAVLVVRNGEVVLAKGYGVADERLRPIDASTLFDVGSISKMFTAAAVLKLQSRGVLSVDDPVSKFYPELPEIASRVTLRHLIAHVSGIDDRVAIQALNFENRDEAVRLAFASKFRGEVGKEFAYCNAGYVVLAAVIEKATGKKFEDVVRDEVFVPAGMMSTGFLDGVGLDETLQTARVIDGRARSGRTVRTTLFAGSVEPWAWGLRGAGGVVTCLNDLMKWRAAVMGESAAFTAEERRAMFTPMAADDVFVPYGFGWFLETTQRGTAIWSHGGSTRGYRADLRVYPEENACIVVLMNESGNPREIAEILAGEMFGTESPRTVLHTSALAFNEHLLAQPDNVRVEVETLDTGARTDRRVMAMSIFSVENAKIATLELTLGAARGVEASMRRWLKSRSKPDDAVERGRPGVTPNVGRDAVDKETGSAVAGSSAFVGMGVYGNITPSADSAVTLPDGMMIEVRPEYRGVREDGTMLRDPRITIVVVDEERGFWPVILQLDDAAAFKLAAELKASIDAKE